MYKIIFCQILCKALLQMFGADLPEYEPLRRFSIFLVGTALAIEDQHPAIPVLLGVQQIIAFWAKSQSWSS